MNARAVVHVDGPPGAGKTTLVETLLRDAPFEFVCIRGDRDKNARRFGAAHQEGDAELRRYADAGAYVVARVRFGEPSIDDFFELDALSGFSDAVVVEGDLPTDFADVAIFVCAPPKDGGSLTRRRGPASSSSSRSSRRSEPSAAAGLSLSKLPPSFFRSLAGRPAPTPIALPEGYEGLENAGLCIVTYRDASERDTAVRFADEITAMRADPALRRDLFGPFVKQVPATVVAADLRNPKDPGTKKAVARVGRTIRRLM
jgi:hypothetical protein